MPVDESRPDPPASPSDPTPRPFSPVPTLDYSNRPAPPNTDTAMMDLLHAVAAMALYSSAIGVLKFAALRWQWHVGAICGVWLAILIGSLGFAGWLYGAFGWRGVMVGTLAGIVVSLLAAPLIFGG